ncbi:MAG: HEAT repeat domain-containing protein [Nitrospira sp.]
MIRRMVVGPMLIFLVVAYLATPVYAASSASTPLQASRVQVEHLLSGYEYLPSGTDLDQLGSGVAHWLVEIVTDQGALNVRRMRALKLLALYAEQPAVHHFLDQFLDRTDQPFVYRRAALIALGSVPDGKSVDRIAGFLDSSNLQLRSAAALALANTRHQRAATLLKQAAAEEQDSALQEKMKHLVHTMESGQ